MKYVTSFLYIKISPFVVLLFFNHYKWILYLDLVLYIYIYTYMKQVVNLILAFIVHVMNIYIYIYILSSYYLLIVLYFLFIYSEGLAFYQLFFEPKYFRQFLKSDGYASGPDYYFKGLGIIQLIFRIISFCFNKHKNLRFPFIIILSYIG